MAIELKHTITEGPNSKVINFRELTGQYDVTDNPGGWGAPNEILGNIVASSLIMKSPSGITYPSFNMTALGFPREDAFIQKEISATDIDSGLTIFEDGFWTVTYTASSFAETFTQTKTFFFYGGVRKQVCSLIADLRLSDCTCDSEAVLRATQMHAYLLALGYAVGLGDTAGAEELYATLQNLIDCSTCK